MHITIQDGTSSVQLSRDLIFSLNENIRATALDNTATVSINEAGLRKTLKSGTGYITTINGIAPTDRGDFFIAGSECDSWGYITGGTASELGETIAGATEGLWLMDLCPSCTTCETIYRLKYETENLRQWINTLKDVNLYVANTVWDANAALSLQRVTGAKAWQGSWIEGATATAVDPNWTPCTGYTAAEGIDGSFMELRSLELLKQYITTVHMWNYAVSINNSITEIQTAPEGTAGFVVQTKRALPSCCNKQRISCEIKVTDCRAIMDSSDDPNNIGDLIDLDALEYPTISVFVPYAKVEFKPFSNAVEEAYAGEDPASSIEGSTTTAIEGSTTASNSMAAIVCVDDLSQQDPVYELHTGNGWVNAAENTWSYAQTQLQAYGTPILRHVGQLGFDKNYQKAIYTTLLEAKVAGTYTLTAKFLPFIGITLYNGKNEVISIRDGSSASSGTKEESTDDSVEYKFIDHEQNIAYPNPSEREYLNSNAAPTRSVDFKLVWTVSVTWKIYPEGADAASTENVEVITQTYNYTCTACRVYYGEAIIKGSTIADLTTPEDTEEEV